MGQDLILTHRETEMAMRTSLAALAMLLPSISGAAACDDYPEEMALAAARRDAKLTQTAPSQPLSAQQFATEPADSVATDVGAAVELTPQQQATANLVGAPRL
jgi:hypothetical protein